jgi:hypothetical protein
MNSKIAIIILTIICALGCNFEVFAQSYELIPYGKNHWGIVEKRLREAKVKSWSIIKVHFGNDGRVIDSVLRSRYKYDEKGTEIESENFDESTGMLNYRKIEVSDSTGLFQYQVEYSMKNKSMIRSDSVYVVYNTFGNAQTSYRYDQDGMLTGWINYYYDSNGSLVETFRVTNEDNMLNRQSCNFQYDGLKLLKTICKETTLDKHDNLTIKCDTIISKPDEEFVPGYKKNANGDIIEHIDGVYRFFFVYNSDYDLIESNIFERGKLENRRVLTYNSNHLKESEIYFKGEDILDQITYHTYEYYK